MLNMSLLLPLLLRILTKAYKSFTFSSGMLRVPLSCLGWTPCFTVCLGTHSPMASLAHFHSFAFTFSQTLTLSFIQPFPPEKLTPPNGHQYAGIVK